MAHKIAEGKNLKWTNGTGGPVASGQPVIVGDVVGVSAGHYADGEIGVVYLEGVFALPKVAADLAQGKKVYWKADANPVGGAAGSGAVTLSSADGAVYTGIVYEAAVTADDVVLVKLAS